MTPDQELLLGLHYIFSQGYSNLSSSPAQYKGTSIPLNTV